jgi:hypothetical protein
VNAGSLNHTRLHVDDKGMRAESRARNLPCGAALLTLLSPASTDTRGTVASLPRRPRPRPPAGRRLPHHPILPLTSFTLVVKPSVCPASGR